jgi:hypothetical protein
MYPLHYAHGIIKYFLLENVINSAEDMYNISSYFVKCVYAKLKCGGS